MMKIQISLLGRWRSQLSEGKWTVQIEIFITTRYNSILYDTVWSDTIRYDTWYDVYIILFLQYFHGDDVSDITRRALFLRKVLFFFHKLNVVRYTRPNTYFSQIFTWLPRKSHSYVKTSLIIYSLQK